MGECRGAGRAGNKRIEGLARSQRCRAVAGSLPDDCRLTEQSLLFHWERQSYGHLAVCFMSRILELADEFRSPRKQKVACQRTAGLRRLASPSEPPRDTHSDRQLRTCSTVPSYVRDASNATDRPVEMPRLVHSLNGPSGEFDDKEVIPSATQRSGQG